MLRIELKLKKNVYCEYLSKGSTCAKTIEQSYTINRLGFGNFSL